MTDENFALTCRYLSQQVWLVGAFISLAIALVAISAGLNSGGLAAVIIGIGMAMVSQEERFGPGFHKSVLKYAWDNRPWLIGGAKNND